MCLQSLCIPCPHSPALVPDLLRRFRLSWQRFCRQPSQTARHPLLIGAPRITLNAVYWQCKRDSAESPRCTCSRACNFPLVTVRSGEFPSKKSASEPSCSCSREMFGPSICHQKSGNDGEIEPLESRFDLKGCFPPRTPGRGNVTKDS